METITTTGSPPTKIVAECHTAKGLRFPKTTAISMRSEVSFLQQSPKMTQINSCHASVVPRKTILHSLPMTKTEADMGADTVKSGIETSDPTRVTSVRFQMQRKCSYGEHFLLVGDHPILGSWDPSKAIPLHWSEEHTWTTDLDMPIGECIQYKFILKNPKGDIHWQPGPDRFFRSWETDNMFVIKEDWEKASNQKISEEEKIMDMNNMKMAHGRAGQIRGGMSGKKKSDHELEDEESWIDPIFSSDEALAKDLKKSMVADSSIATDKSASD